MKFLKNYIVFIALVLILGISACAKKNVPPPVEKETIAPPVQEETVDTTVEVQKSKYNLAKEMIDQAEAEYTKALDAGLKDYLKEAGSELDKAKALFDEEKYDDAMASAKKTIALINEAYAARERDLDKAAKMNSAKDYLDTANNMLVSAKNEEAPLYAPDLYDKASSAYAAAKAAFDSEDYDKAISLSKDSIEYAKQAIKVARKVKLEKERSTSEKEKKIEEALKRGAIQKLNEYKVVQGDCLWNISKKPEIYGTPLKWKRIWFANEDQIVDPDLIYPDQIFDIPR